MTSATSIPSTPTSAGPTFTFPADYHLTVDPDTTGDPVKDAILADNAWFLQADQEAIASGNVNDPLLQRYAQPDSLPLWQQGVKEEHAKGTLSGTERFYNRVVLSVDTTKNPPVAALYVCDDQSKLRAAGGHVLDVFGMVKDADGTWKTLISTPAQSTQQVKQQCP